MKRALFLLALGGCTASQEAAPIGEARSRIVKGTDSDDTQNSTVLVMHYDALAGGGGAASGCTGTVLAPTLVLTARHCVAITDEGAACDSQGNAVQGGKVERDHDPSKIYVFGGTTRPDFLSGNFDPSRGREILSTGVDSLCNNDIALLVLDKPVTGAKIAPIRLSGTVDKSELLTVIGWGISDTELNPEVRKQRTAVPVLDVGPVRGLGPTEFRVGEGTCSGDSGGPALSAQGAVIGALSRGGNGSKDVGADGCVGGTNIFTSTFGHADFLRNGYARVGAEPWIEGEPMPVVDAGVPAASAPPGRDDDDDGCNASSRRTGGLGAAFLSIVAVLFSIGRRGNTAKSRKNTG